MNCPPLTGLIESKRSLFSQTGLFEFNFGASGIGLTKIETSATTLLQIPDCAIAEYFPDFNIEIFSMVGSLIVEKNPLGPFQLIVELL